MEVSDYLNQPGLDKLIQEARFIKHSGKRFSDIEDDKGLQYVDFVCEAQGVAFMSLLGYSFILEEAGINFFNLGGISSGSLNAMVVAALGQKQYKSICMLRAFNKRPITEVSSLQYPNGSANLMRKVSQLRNRLLSTKSQPFKQSHAKRLLISEAFRELGITNLAELHKISGQKPNGLKHIFGGNIEDLSPRLAIITSDISTHTKVELPRMAELYWRAPENVSPVELALAGMAIPYSQDGYVLENIPKNKASDVQNWRELANFHHEIPEKIRFMDGSVIYHPPSDLFQRAHHMPPRMPTFTAIACPGKGVSNSSHPFASALIGKGKEKSMEDYLNRHPEYRSVLTKINISVDGDLHDFDSSDETKLQLFKQGVQAGLEFLTDFDWESYKNKRTMDVDQRLIQAAIDVRFAS